MKPKALEQGDFENISAGNFRLHVLFSPAFKDFRTRCEGYIWQLRNYSARWRLVTSHLNVSFMMQCFQKFAAMDSNVDVFSLLLIQSCSLCCRVGIYRTPKHRTV